MSEWDGVTYRQVSSLQDWLAERGLAGFDITAARRVLDIGCGDGRVTARIAARLPGSTVVGIDPSAGMLSVAQSAEQLSFCRADARNLPFRGSFDVIVSFNALHWVTDQQRVLAQIARVLRRDGRALVVMVGAGQRPSLERVAMDVTAAPRWRRYFVDYAQPFVHPDADLFRGWVEEVGLRLVDFRVDDLSMDFGSASRFRRWATAGFSAWTSRLPGDTRELFMTDVLTAYRAITGSASTFRFMQLTAKLTHAE
jgi:trans-aconitate 2-methyltransferase